MLYDSEVILLSVSVQLPASGRGHTDQTPRIKNIVCDFKPSHVGPIDLTLICAFFSRKMTKFSSFNPKLAKK